MKVLQKSVISELFKLPLLIIVITFAVVSVDLPSFLPVGIEGGITYNSFRFYLVMFLAFSAGAVMIFLRWRKRNIALTEFESYLVLVILAVYCSIIFAFVNYGIYMLDRSAFLIDQKLNDHLYDEAESALTQEINGSKRIIEVFEQTAEALSQRRDSLFSRKSDIAFTDEIVIDLPHSYILLQTLPTGIDSLSPDNVFLTLGVDSLPALSLSPNKHQGSQTLLSKLNQERDFVRKADLIEVLKYRAEWERRNRLDGLSDNLANLTIPELNPSIFIFQWSMDLLASSPRYVVPSSFTTRLLAFSFSLLRFVFMGRLILIIANFRSTLTKE